MLQFMALANDYTDAHALERRLQAREAHLARMAIEKEKGNLVVGGAKLNEAGKMVGSMVIINAENDYAARLWLQEDPYIAGQVWETVEVLPFKLADV